MIDTSLICAGNWFAFSDRSVRGPAAEGIGTKQSKACIPQVKARFKSSQAARLHWHAIIWLVVHLSIGFACGSSLAAQTSESDVQLYFFTNPGCAPCRQVEPEITKLSQAGYPVTTVLLDQHPQWAQTFSVDRTPTVIMVAGQRVVGRHAGLIDADTLQKWFAAVGGEPRQATQPDNNLSTRSSVESDTGSKRSGSSTAALEAEPLRATYAQLPDSARFDSAPGIGKLEFKGSPTLHSGTTRPANEAERLAMNATVRLKVQDTEGISYATGTVIHSHAGEWLVLTCGHTFREAGHRGTITAEYGFLSGNIQSASGELISYDAESRDVALVAIHAGQDLTPVPIAHSNTAIDRGLNVFSIGCDGGSNPTIRHTQIKTKAVYAPGEATAEGIQSPGAVKYDIYGRPAIGRSGGGLFNAEGQLIGVCNAAAVESDEGIYSALDSLHWQIADANLRHLFEEPGRHVIVANPTLNPSHEEGLKTDRLASWDADSNRQPLGQPLGQSHPLRSIQPLGAAKQSGLQADDSDTEVIIIVRSRSAPQLGESITISDPSPQLIEYLGEMKTGAESRKLDLARVRQSNPLK